MFSKAHINVLNEYAMSIAFSIQHQISVAIEDRKELPLRWAVNPFTYGLIKDLMFSYPIDWSIDNSLDDFEARRV